MTSQPAKIFIENFSNFSLTFEFAKKILKPVVAEYFEIPALSSLNRTPNKRIRKALGQSLLAGFKFCLKWLLKKYYLTVNLE